MTRTHKPKPPAPRTPPKGDGKRDVASRIPRPEPGRSDSLADGQERLAKITGLPAVAALFRTDPQRVMRLYYDERLKNAVGVFCAHMARLRRAYRLVNADELSRIAGTVMHGGIIAAAKPRLVPELDVEAARRWAHSGLPLLILDGVSNPHNLGAIARTLAFLGLEHLVLSDHPYQAGLSDAAHRVAEGGLEYLQVYRTACLPQVLRRLQSVYRVLGTTLGEKAVDLASLPEDVRPIALVLGNEEEGLSPQTLAACETAVTIRGSGKVQSLNVSVTAAILIYELCR